jgi:hypothetical protein
MNITALSAFVVDSVAALDSPFFNAHLVAVGSGLYNERVVLDSDYTSYDAADCRYLIAYLKAAAHFLSLFFFLVLRPDEQKIEYQDEHKEHDYHVDSRIRSVC